ncbi:hypothetical protein [Nonomuraea guangzhouensis]|uniref:Uncharacterized protein n=1 Tax=Nonomuraea guangzhouensis TaxID=1291555 RepID=A0ABW4GY43_9ACTN|nr:hypothetical protein [Nonomuraea guangzhouensis]
MDDPAWFPPQCISRHPYPARSHAEKLIWNVPYGHDVRVVAWTCECSSPFYVLCQAGGQRFIRRTRSGPDKRIVDESDRWPDKQADAQWNALLLGLLH